MKLLSLWQPWATLIAIGAKQMETRSWGTDYRGELGIHAAKKVDRAAFLWGSPLVLDALVKAGIFLPREAASVFADWCVCSDIGSLTGFRLDRKLAKRFPIGTVVASVRLRTVDRIDDGFLERVRPLEEACGDFSIGRFAWGLYDLRRVNGAPPVRGRQGLWDEPLIPVVGA